MHTYTHTHTHTHTLTPWSLYLMCVHDVTYMTVYVLRRTTSVELEISVLLICIYNTQLGNLSFTLLCVCVCVCLCVCVFVCICMSWSDLSLPYFLKRYYTITRSALEQSSWSEKNKSATSLRFPQDYFARSIFWTHCVFVLTCFSISCNYTQATQTHNSLALVLFHFPASLPITVILNKETERKSNTKGRDEK